MRQDMGWGERPPAGLLCWGFHRRHLVKSSQPLSREAREVKGFAQGHTVAELGFEPTWT